MKAFVDWLLVQRQRAIIIAVVAAPLLPIVAAALITLETARRGVRQGLVSAGFVIAGLCLLGVLSRGSLSMFLAIGLVSTSPGILVGALLRRVSSLTFAFQAVWLGCFVVVGALAAFGPEPQVLFAPLLQELQSMLQGPGYTEAEMVDITARLASMLPAVTLLPLLLGALFIGYWWWTLAAGESRLGVEFRRLKLGRWLGALATAIVAIGLVFGAPLVQNLLPLALLGFVVQGLAVIHAWAFTRRWHPSLLIGLYVLLVVPPLTVLATAPLSIIGCVDNWVSLRKPLGTAA